MLIILEREYVEPTRESALAPLPPVASPPPDPKDQDLRDQAQRTRDGYLAMMKARKERRE